MVDKYAEERFGLDICIKCLQRPSSVTHSITYGSDSYFRDGLLVVEVLYFVRCKLCGGVYCVEDIIRRVI